MSNSTDVGCIEILMIVIVIVAVLCLMTVHEIRDRLPKPPATIEVPK